MIEFWGLLKKITLFCCNLLLCVWVRYSPFLCSLKDWKCFIKVQLTSWGQSNILLLRKLLFIGRGLIPILSVPRYKLPLCHSPIKSDLLSFLGVESFVCGLLYHVIKSFASLSLIPLDSPISIPCILISNLLILSKHLSITKYI